MIELLDDVIGAVLAGLLPSLRPRSAFDCSGPHEQSLDRFGCRSRVPQSFPYALWGVVA